MFAVLEERATVSRKRRWFHRRVVQPLPQLEPVPVPGGVSFYALRISARKSGPDWRLIRRAAGHLSGKLLLPNELTPPQGSGCFELVPRRYPYKLLFNTAVSVIRACHLDPLGCTITVLDGQGKFSSEIRQLVPLAAAVRVITQHPARYYTSAEAVLDEFGATLLFSDAPNAALDSDFILVLDAQTTVCAGRNTVVFTNRKENLRVFTISGDGVDLPEAYEALLPRGVTPECFAGALYEHCAALQLGALCYSRLQLSGVTMPFDDMILCAKNQVQQAFRDNSAFTGNT